MSKYSNEAVESRAKSTVTRVIAELTSKGISTTLTSYQGFGVKFPGREEPIFTVKEFHPGTLCYKFPRFQPFRQKVAQEMTKGSFRKLVNDAVARYKLLPQHELAAADPLLAIKFFHDKTLEVEQRIIRKIALQVHQSIASGDLTKAVATLKEFQKHTLQIRATLIPHYGLP